MRSNLKKYCVIGYPIKHSLSPKIFNKWFKQLKIPAKYEAVEVRPGNLAEFMRNFREKYAGANVTVPHKESILRFLDKLSPEARAIGAVNVIVNRGGKLIGYNTDVFGAMEALKERMKEKGNRMKMEVFGKFLHGKRVTVLGAGGAARAIVYGLKKAGAKITILNRTVSRAEKLAQDFKCKFGAIADFNPSQCNILINATSVGLWPRTSESPFHVSLFTLHASRSIVMDIIYRPHMTKFLRDAKKAGCSIITGDKMFLAQAIKTFEIWTGYKFALAK